MEEEKEAKTLDKIRTIIKTGETTGDQTRKAQIQTKIDMGDKVIQMFLIFSFLLLIIIIAVVLYVND